MDKNVIFLIIVVLLLVCGVGAYLLSDSNVSDLGIDSLTDQYTNNDSNISVNGSDQEKIQDNGTGNLSDNNNYNNNYFGNDKSSDNNHVKVKTITSKSDVTKEANKILNSNKDFFGKNAVVKNVKYDGNGLWSADFVDSKTGKKVGTTYIDDKTGKMVDAM